MMQEVLIYVLLGAALLFLGWKYLKPKKKDNCGPDCNCG